METQHILVMPEERLIAVRLCDAEGKTYDPRYTFGDLTELLRQL